MMFGLLNDHVAGPCAVRPRASRSLVTQLPARQHLARQLRSKLVASSQHHPRLQQPDERTIEPLDPKHGAKQRQQQQDSRGPGPPRWKIWLGSIPRILAPFRSSAGAEPTAAEGKGLTWKFVLAQLRMLLLGCLAAFMLMLVRYTALLQARTSPREMLYSDFVTLVDTGRVKAARLEAASNRLYFECNPQDAPQAQQHQQQQQLAPAAPKQ